MVRLYRPRDEILERQVEISRGKGRELSMLIRRGGDGAMRKLLLAALAAFAAIDIATSGMRAARAPRRPGHRRGLRIHARPPAGAAAGKSRFQGRLQVERDHPPRARRRRLGEPEPRRRLQRGLDRARREELHAHRTAGDQGPLLHGAGAQRLGRDHRQHQRAEFSEASLRQVCILPQGRDRRAAEGHAARELCRAGSRAC